MAKAASKYKQVRITLTEEACHGRPDKRNVTIRVMVKPLHAEWTMRHTVLHSTEVGLPPLETLDSVYAAILEFLTT